MTTPDPEAMRLAQAAMAALSRRDFAAVRNAGQALLLRRPDDPNGHQLLGIAALELGELDNAKRHLERASKAAPNQPQILNTLGVALRRLEDHPGARRAFRRAGELGLIDGWRNLGNLESVAHDDAASIAAYRKALKLAPDDAAAHAGLAQAFERSHDLALAKQHAERALSGDPRNETARLALAEVLLRERQFDEADRVVFPVARRASTPANQAVAWGLLGEARDRRGDAAGAFEAFTAANQILLAQNAALLEASHLIYHPDGVRRMTALVTRADVQAWRAPAFTDPAPVFLVGFPRSGTTLLDQVLSSHPDVACIEEKEHFANALAGVITDQAKLDALEDLSAGEIAAARADYWARVRGEGVAPDTPVVVDKLPLNIVVLPLIKRVFPDAKIIFALRDPRDVILSCYQQRFGMNAAMAQFLELERAAAYYDAVMTLMQASRERLALDLHQIRYEDVVADLESAARGLAAFLGLAFDERMLRFNETAMKRAIRTPSARQVIQPLYARSSGRWRRYAAELAPALPLLDPWAVRFGYEPA